MTWIIIALLFAAAAAAGFRIKALTRDEPPEPTLAHRWRRTMGGGSPDDGLEPGAADVAGLPGGG
jgi:hypothetical protein